MDLFLFTTLTDPTLFPLANLVQLYGRRWEVELDYRAIKSSMDMEEFAVQRPDIFRKELAAGLLTYNLIRAMLVQAAQQGQLLVSQLSFVRGLRRLRDALLSGVPGWVLGAGDPTSYLLTRLAQCRLSSQPTKVRHEPRKVRRRPDVYPALKGDRQLARHQVLRELGWIGEGTNVDHRQTPQSRQSAQPKAA